MSLRSFVFVVFALIAGCSTTSKIEPTPLQPFEARLTDHSIWQTHVGAMNPNFAVAIKNGQIVLASEKGKISALDIQTGALRWKLDLDDTLSAAVGADAEGATFAVVSLNNELIVFSRDKMLWKKQLQTKVITPPLVAGQRIFVHGIDRTIFAFDAAEGQQLWVYRRSGDPLSLNYPGVLLPFQNTLLVGVGAKLAALDASTGKLQQEWAIASPRGTNEIERLADVVGPAARVQDKICVRAYQASVACVQIPANRLLWTQAVVGYNGISAFESDVIGVNANDRIESWRSDTGVLQWRNETLLNRKLSIPGRTANAIVVGDQEGWVHFLSPENGTTLLRLKTDGSAIVGQPQYVDATLIVVTNDGGVFAFRAN
jgi:outer membrane assembly lipoprotein YfgL